MDDAAAALNDGSSPLARGTPGRARGGAARGRFIPARAGNTCSSLIARSSRPVHPRSRGEHPAIVPPVPNICGSSPLARGTLIREHGRHLVHRFIPARAGNTVVGSRVRCSATVHPRSRGEHLSSVSASAAARGSSPLARGTRHLFLRQLQFRRFIPARAGNTRGTPCRMATRSVHPRSRGEHMGWICWPKKYYGSSPLARGTRRSRPRTRAMVRFIPARAGNTCGIRRARSRCPVHPRSRGEHICRTASAPPSAGSSPLARGTPQPNRRARHDRRFIPARAGNTAALFGIRGSSTVHPRSRGEHAVQHPAQRLQGGSSPLARGTQPRAERALHFLRFIPARAGNTWPRPPTTARAAVHPRSRGEHVGGGAMTRLSNGSSPLARGTLSARPEPYPEWRFIPARAGNTLLPTCCLHFKNNTAQNLPIFLLLAPPNRSCSY